MKTMQTRRSRYGHRQRFCYAFVVGACSTMLTATGALASDPDEVVIQGTVRDFQESHPDFSLSTNTGHVAHNVALTSGSNRPLFTGTGFAVDTQWRNIYSQNIPPHLTMYGFGGGKIPVVNETTPPSGAHHAFDTYDSQLGPYGEDGNVGPAPEFDTGAPMPPVGVPQWMYNLPSQGDVDISGPLSSNTIDEDMRVHEMRIQGSVLIEGDVNILCEGKFRLNTHGKIVLADGASLNLYLVDGSDEIAGADAWNHVEVGDPLDPHRVKIYNLSTSPVEIHNHAQVWAVIISPYAPLSLANHGELFGLFAGLEILFGTHGKLHIDEGSMMQICDELVSDTLGTEGSSSHGEITSAETFEQWFTNIPGVNASMGHEITLKRNSSGVYEYLNDSFFPIDDELFGNEGEAHNFNFTFMFQADFEFDSCAEQFFEFQGADDAWVYIDGELALDLGGVMPLEAQVVELDRLELEDGETYTLHFFYAQRNTDLSVFRIRTDLPLQSQPTFTVTSPFD